MKHLLACLLLLCSMPLWSADYSQNYESALSAYEESKIEEAFIHLKNALQENPSHLPSTLLMGKVYFTAGNMAAAEQLFDEALELGADLHLVLPLLGTSLLLQRKVDELLVLEEQYYSLNDEGRFEWHLLRGQAYLLENKPELAEQEFKSALQLFPDEVRARNLIATFLIQTGQADSAEDWVVQSLQLQPNNEKTLELMGELRQRQGNLDQALNYYQQAYKLDNDDPVIQRGLAQVYFGLAQYQQAGEMNDKLLTLSPSDPTANLMKAWLLNRQGKTKESLTLLSDISSKLARLDPAGELYKGSNQYLHGLVEYLQGNIESTRSILGRLLEERPNEDRALRILVETYVQASQVDKAVSLLEQHQRLTKSNLDLSLTLFQLYLQQNNQFRAEQLLRELNRKFPEQSAILIARANLLSLQGKSEQALQVIAGLEVPVQNLGFHLLKSKLLLDTGRSDQALSISEQLLKDYSEHIDVLNLHAAVLIETGQFPQAENVIQAVLKQSPDNLSANFNLAILAYKQNNYAQAEQLTTAIIKLHPDNVRAILLLADLSLSQQQLDEAANWINKALLYKPGHAQASRRLLQIYVQLQKWPEASTLANQLRQNNRLDPELVYLQAQVLMAQKNYTTAKTNLDLLYDLWSTSAPQLLSLAAMQAQIKDIAGARKSLTTAELIAPESVDIKLAQTRLELTDGDLAAAKSYLKSLSNMQIKASQLSLIKAELAAVESHWPQALQHLQLAIKQDENNLAAIAMFYQLSRQGIGAAEFQQAIEQRLSTQAKPDWVRKLLADSYLDTQQSANAIQHYEQLLSTPEFENHPAVLNNLANLYAVTDLEKALTTAERAKLIGQPSPALMDTLGWLNARMGRYDQALPLLREAYVLDAGNPEIRYHLGYVLSKLNRLEEARVQLQEATKSTSYPEFQDAVLLLDSLKK